MLISHHHRFVFVKPRKTAGTTVELALSPFLQAGDLATPIEVEEEPLRQVLPGVRIGLIGTRPGFGRAGALRDHSPLSHALRRLPVIADYRIVSMCRNPWDRAVSQFFWSLRRTDMRQRSIDEQRKAFADYTRKWGPRTWLDRFYGRKRQRALDATPLYFVDGQCRASYFVRFEALAEDVAELGSWLGLEGTPQIGAYAAKAGLRPVGSRNWTGYYDNDTRRLVAEECRWEIDTFGYDFEGTAVPNGPKFSAMQDFSEKRHRA
ncbi:MAG: hypothetical protein ACK4MS_14050 [Paracoccaceae bacterium]